MSVEDPDVVDLIGVENETGAVVLTITDHLDWADSPEHLWTLQEKLNRYLAFIESGELLEKYPNASGRPVRIEVIFKYEPSRQAIEFLCAAAATIHQADISFEWRVLVT